MILEASIKQTKFRSEHHKMLLNIIYSAGIIMGEQERFFKQYDLSPQQYNVLRILRGQHPKPASIGLLQDRMLDKMSNASRLVEKLKQKNLLTRDACENDRRQMDVCITKQGLELLAELDGKFSDVENKLSVLSKEEAETLNKLLDKLNT
jgi:DNA-binding MarR family transcriptional regulator